MTTPQQALDQLDVYHGEDCPFNEGPNGHPCDCGLSDLVATLRKALEEPARFRVSVGDHHAEIRVSPNAPAAYHQGMVEAVVAEAMRRALGRVPSPGGEP